MPHNFSKIKLNKFALFSLGSKRFGYGHYKRIKNLILIIKKKNHTYNHYSFGEKFKTKKHFIKKINYEANIGSIIILDISNNLFLKKNTLIELKNILRGKIFNKIYIIDAPTKDNLSSYLKLKNARTLIPFEISSDIRKKFKKIKNKKIGYRYFIYPYNDIKRKRKIYDIILSFGGSDNYSRTYYVLKLLEILKLNKKVLVVFGKYFKKEYKKKIINLCKKNKFKKISFSDNFTNLLNKSRILITNSGLTKYEGYFHNLKVIVFSDDKKSEEVDSIFVRKTKQFKFSFVRDFFKDKIKLKKILIKDKKYSSKNINKNVFKSNINNIKNFFYL